MTGEGVLRCAQDDGRAAQDDGRAAQDDGQALSPEVLPICDMSV